MAISGQDRVKLSQWDALMLESLRALGWTNEELLSRVRTGDLPEDESEYHFDYRDLAAYAEANRETFESAVTQGYRIKYNTVRGIRCWISVVFGKEPELELEEGREAVTASLTAEERERLSSALSYGWEIHGEQADAAGETSSYRIEPIQR